MIRKAERGDLAACAALIRKSFMTVAEQLGLTEDNAPRFTAFSVTPERLERQMDEGRPMFVCEEDGVLCGYCSLLLGQDGECELNNLAVLPEFRHRGIGGRLLARAVSAAEDAGCTVMNIGIVEENRTLRQWYERCGAVHCGTAKFDFFPFTCGYMKIGLRGAAAKTGPGEDSARDMGDRGGEA